MKTLKIMIPMFLFSLLISCSISKDNANYTISQGKYEVLMKTGNRSEKAVLILDEDFNYEIEYTDPDSPLCGFKKAVNQGKYICSYESIETDQSIVPASDTLIWESLLAMKSEPPQQIRKKEYNETECLEYIWETGEMQIKYLTRKADSFPVYLNAIGCDTSITINFCTDEK